MGQLLNNRTCRKCGVELIVGNNWSTGASLKPDCICRSCKTAASRKWVEANPERAAATKAAWTEANRDRLKQLSRNWQEQNREKTRVSSAKWRHANPEKRKATTARYRAANPDRELINAASPIDIDFNAYGTFTHNASGSFVAVVQLVRSRGTEGGTVIQTVQLNGSGMANDTWQGALPMGCVGDILYRLRRRRRRLGRWPTAIQDSGTTG